VSLIEAELVTNFSSRLLLHENLDKTRVRLDFYLGISSRFYIFNYFIIVFFSEQCSIVYGILEDRIFPVDCSTNAKKRKTRDSNCYPAVKVKRNNTSQKKAALKVKLPKLRLHPKRNKETFKMRVVNH